MAKEKQTLGPESLACPRCGKKGRTVQVHEEVKLQQGMLDFPHYRCQACGMKWYEFADVVALVISWGCELIPKRTVQPEASG